MYSFGLVRYIHQHACWFVGLLSVTDLSISSCVLPFLLSAPGGFKVTFQGSCGRSIEGNLIFKHILNLQDWCASDYCLQKSLSV